MTKCKGTWIVESKVPSTPKIRYRTSPTGAWVEVVGGTVHTLEPVYGTNPNRSYIVKIKMRWSIGRRTGSVLSNVYWQREVTYYSEAIAGEIVGVMPVAGLFGDNHLDSLRARAWAGLSVVTLQVRNSAGAIVNRATGNTHGSLFSTFTATTNPHTNTIDPVGSAKDATTFGTVSGSFAAATNQGNYGGVYFSGRVDSASIVGILPAVANQPPDGYRLQVKDCGGNLLADVTFPTQPEVEIKPSLMPEEWSSEEVSAPLRQSLGYPIEGYYLVLDKANLNQIKVRLRHDSDSAFEWLVKLFERHPCADGQTQVKIECSDEHSCPAGTCEVSCSGHRCCYNSEGISVKTLPARG